MQGGGVPARKKIDEILQKKNQIPKPSVACKVSTKLLTNPRNSKANLTTSQNS